MHRHDVRHVVHGRDRRDVADEIEIELVVERRVDRVESTDQEQRVTVGRGTHDRLGGDIAAGSRTVLDDERLTEPLRQPLTYQARRDVRTASGREANNDAHRPRWIGLRPSNMRHGRERGSAVDHAKKANKARVLPLRRWGTTLEPSGVARSTCSAITSCTNEAAPR